MALANGDIEDISSALNDMSKQMTKIATTIDFITRDISDLCAERSKLSKELDSVQQKIGDINVKMAVLQTKAETAETTCNGHSSAITELQRLGWKEIGYASGIATGLSTVIAFAIKFFA